MNCVCLLQLPAWHKAISTNCLTQLPCWEQPRTFVVYLVFSSCSLLSSRCHICSCFQCFQQGTVCPSWNWARAAGWVRSPSSSDKYFSKDDLQLLLSLPQPAFRREGGRSSKANKTSRSKLTIETQRPHMGPDGYSLSSVVAKLLQGGEKKKISDLSMVLKLWEEVVTSGYHLSALDILLLASSLSKFTSIGGH